MRRLIFVRHGECEMNLNLANRVGGRSNESPLTPLGVKQAKALGRHLATCVIRHHSGPLGPCYTSTAVRARDTLSIALETAKQAGHPWLTSEQGHHIHIEESEELLEIDMGEWSGAVRSHVYTPETVARIDSDPYHFAPPGGESQCQVETRIHDYITKHVLPKIPVGGPPAIIVGHGYAIKSFMRGVLKSDPALTHKLVTDNTSVTEFVWDGNLNRWILTRFNDCTHLFLDQIVKTI